MKTNNKELRFAIIGAGMAGILSGIKLLEAGYKNVTIYEKADSLGGTWFHNSYPGLTCDVPSHSYTYSFAPNPDWSRYLPPGPEVLQYFEQVVENYNLNAIIKYNQEISTCTFDTGCWRLETKQGLASTVDFVIAATGVLHHPNQPNIDGAESFSGLLFHSACWDHSSDLMGKKVGVIGNGSTGVQLVSALVSKAGEVSHFQRTPQWIMPVENPAYTEEQITAFRNDPVLLKSIQNDEGLDASIEWFSRIIVDPNSEEMQQLKDVVLANLENSVADSNLKNRLRPSYEPACKRLIYSPDYYQAIQSPNASLVDAGICCIEPKGIRTSDGELHELDIIVYATGFKADQFMRPMKVTGHNNIELNDLWSDTPSAYLAVSVPDFPNFFMLNGPNGPVGNFSLIEIAEHQWHYISQLIELVSEQKCKGVSASKEAYEQFNKDRLKAAKSTIFGTGCKSWYLDKNGIPSTWPWSRKHFAERMQKPTLDDYELLN